MIEYQPEMDPDEELFGSEEEARRFRQEREASWTPEAQWARTDEGVRIKKEWAGKVEESIRRGVQQAEAGEARELTPEEVSKIIGRARIGGPHAESHSRPLTEQERQDLYEHDLAHIKKFHPEALDELGRS